MGLNLNNASMSLGFDTLKNNMHTDDFASTSLPSSQQQTQQNMQKHNSASNVLTASVNNKMCGYTIWVQWCDSSELHGYYQCVGLRNNKYHFKHRKDENAELFADAKGYWYLVYDSKCLYKSKKKTHDDPPPRNWKCIEGSLPPPGVSKIDLPDDATPMVIIDEDKMDAELEEY